MTRLRMSRFGEARLGAAGVEGLGAARLGAARQALLGGHCADRPGAAWQGVDRFVAAGKAGRGSARRGWACHGLVRQALVLFLLKPSVV